VIAWNQPILRSPAGYVLGLSVLSKHVIINPFSGDIMAAMAPKLDGYEVNKKTFKVPFGWKVDEKLLDRMVRARLAELVS